MALTDGAVIIPGTGHIYTAPAETAVPTTTSAPEEPWEEIGHTARDEGLTIDKEGGESTVLGSWQNSALRERRDPTTFFITFNLLQVDNGTLDIYFGAPGDTSGTDKYGVTGQGAPTELALFVRMVDGTNEAGLYVPRSSLFSESGITVDVENFLSFPVRATILQVTGSNLMEWLKAGLGTTV